MGRLAGAIVATCGLSLALAVSAQARPGDVDTTFGTGGETAFRLSDTPMRVRGLAQQSDGKLLVSANATLPSSPTDRVVVLRFTPDGSHDSTFGSDPAAGTPLVWAFGDPLVDARDRITLVGRVASGSGASAAVARLLPDGHEDQSFGAGGVVRLDGGPPSFDARGGFLQADGSTVVVGVAAQGGESVWALARVTEAGVLDTSFGDAGWVVTDTPGTGAVVSRGVEQPDGKLVVAGETAGNGTPAYRWTLARYQHDGSLDTGFGDGGIALAAFGGFGGWFGDVVLQPDGRLLTSGAAPLGDETSSMAFAVSRTAADGALDSSFGDGGGTRIPAPPNRPNPVWAQASRIVLQSDGKIAVAGRVLMPRFADQTIRSRWGLARLRTDGTPDPEFGDEGGVFTSIASEFEINAGLVRTHEGKLVVGGDSSACGERGLSLVRYHAEDPDADRPDGGPTMRTCGSAVTSERDGDLPIPAQCPFTEDVCTGTARVDISASSLSAARRALRAGKRKFRLKGGRRKTLTVHTTRAVRRLLRRRGRLRATIVYTARDGDGHRRVTHRKIKLRARR